jgi:uncharacterized membrane protein
MITALSLGFLIVATAFTVDLGRQILRRRDMQAIADVVSLDLVHDLNGRTVATIEADPNWALDKQHSAERNSFTAGGLTVELGHITTANNQKTFVSDEASPSAVPTAVRVTARDTVNYFFYPGSGNVSRTAIGSTDATLDYQIGSFLAGVNPSSTQVDLLNKVLKAALHGGSLNLDAVSYQGLASGTVSLRGIATQLGVASPDQLANSTVNARQLFTATAQVMQANGASPTAVAAMNNAATAVDSNATVHMSDVITESNVAVAQGGGTDAFDTQFSALTLLTGSAFAINGNSALSVPSLDFSLPGFGAVTVSLTVIQKPAVKLGAPVGFVLSTSQVQMSITVPINALDVTSVVGGSLPGLSLVTLTGSMTVTPNMGSASATPTAIDCGTSNAPAKSTTIAATPTPVSTAANETISMIATLPILGSRTLSTTTASGSLTTTGSSESGTFAYTTGFMPPVGTGAAQRLGAATLNLSSSLQATSVNTTVLTIPVGSSSAAVIAAENLALNNAVFPKVQDTMIPLITRTLGLELGGGDVGALNMHCGGSKLAG